MKQCLKQFAGAMVVFSVIIGLPVWAQAEVARYDVDLDHSIVGFEVAHMVISKTTGRFTDYQGFIIMDPEKKEVKAIEAVVQTESLNTNHKKRDEHLRSPDFFNVKKYPTMTYKMKSYTKTGDQYTAVGDLTLLGVTKGIALVGAFNGVVTDPMGNTRAGFTAEGTINRKDFGMVWTKLLDNGGLVVGDNIKIKLEVETIKEKKKS
ncbi:MAG: YceI family protein [Nitrospira sp.]|nr:YceI family protein [Nitrospira sp.]